MGQEPISPKIIVGVPAFNEEKYIGSLVLRAKQYATELIVADDGSTDRTSEIARLAGATVIRHEQNRGKGAGVQEILAEARKRDADILVIIDADFQHDPDEIPSLIKAVLEGYDLVIGSRRLPRSRIPRYRRLGQRTLSYFTGVLTKSKISDSESGFRALSKKAISEMQLEETGFAVETEMISEATHRGLKLKEVPVSIIYTKDGSTLNPVRHGVGVLNRIVAMIAEKRPLLFFGLVGGICVLAGIAFGGMVIRTYYTSYALATGTALISMLLTTIGVLSIFTGLILNVLLKRIGKSL
jgi:glycosyltransferase involved in cell wall biosynthesis